MIDILHLFLKIFILTPLFAALFFALCFSIDLVTNGKTGGFWIPYAEKFVALGLRLVNYGVTFLEYLGRVLNERNF